eukprot:11204617-Lingulodinium_polyedra.AAC.1
MATPTTRAPSCIAACPGPLAASQCPRTTWRAGGFRRANSSTQWWTHGASKGCSCPAFRSWVC